MHVCMLCMYMHNVLVLNTCMHMFPRPRPTLGDAARAHAGGASGWGGVDQVRGVMCWCVDTPFLLAMWTELLPGSGGRVTTVTPGRAACAV